MNRWLAIPVIFWAMATFAAEPMDVSFVLHGRAPLHSQASDSPTYGLMDASVFSGEPVIITVTALNTPADRDAWIRGLRWRVVTAEGTPISAEIERTADSAATAPYAHRLLPNATFANFSVKPLPPGQYTVTLTWADPASGSRQTARRSAFAVYRGDETPLVRSFYLRERASAELAKGTLESYRVARAFLLEAADGSTDPSVYDELADASVPWAPPTETATYYQRSLDIAKRALEKNFGAERDWPEKARQLYRPRERKVNAFRDLVSYYSANFKDVRVVFVGDRSRQKFVIHRRNDGAVVREVPINQ